MEKTVKITKVSFWGNIVTYLALLLIICGIWLGLLVLGIVPNNDVPEIGSFEFIFYCISTIFVILASLFIMIFWGEEHRCYYCEKTINNIKTRIVVEWPKNTKYSNKEVQLTKALHTSCHKTAKEKFRIPDPRFSRIEI